MTSRCVIYARRKNKIFHAPSQPPLSPSLTKRSGIPTFRTKERRSLNETLADDGENEYDGESGSGETESTGKNESESIGKNETGSEEETVKERRSLNEEFEESDDIDEVHGDKKYGKDEDDNEDDDEDDISSGSGDSVLRERRGLIKVSIKSSIIF